MSMVKAAGVIEAKKQGATLTGVERQSDRYAKGLPSSLPAWNRPLPFAYESTGTETHFTNGLDPEPRARNVFAFHRAEMLTATPNKQTFGFFNQNLVMQYGQVHDELRATWSSE